MPTRRPQRPRVQEELKKKKLITDPRQEELSFGEQHKQVNRYFTSTNISPKNIERFCFPELELVEKYLEYEDEISSSRRAYEVTRDWARQHELLGEISDAQFGQVQLKEKSANPKLYDLLLGLYSSRDGIFVLRYKHNLELYSKQYTKPQIFLLTLMEHENWASARNHPDKIYITRLFLEIEQLATLPTTTLKQRKPEQRDLF